MIKGLTAREPVGVVATIGHKGDRGQPVDTDRFFLVLPTAEKVGSTEIRRPHPEFRAFNEADPERRQMLKGTLVHLAVTECWEYHLKAQVLPGLAAHPSRAPHCTGDGSSARRWDGQQFTPILCPNELCKYRQGDGAKVCKPFGRVLFRLRWADGVRMPGLLCKLTTQSWHSVAALKGFFDYVTQQAQLLGGPLGIYGVPFGLTLSRKTKSSQGQEGKGVGRAFPVMSASPDGDLQQFFVARAAALRASTDYQLAAQTPRAALTDGEQQAEKYLDAATIEPPRLPMEG